VAAQLLLLLLRGAGARRSGCCGSSSLVDFSFSPSSSKSLSHRQNNQDSNDAPLQSSLLIPDHW